MSLPWPLKEAFMDYVRGDQEENPYVVELNSGIEEKLSEFVEQRVLSEWRSLVCVSNTLGRQSY